MIIARRSLSTLLLVLCSLSIVTGQELTPPTAHSPVPIVTATASQERVRYASLGEVQQTRLQVFSADGSQVYDSTFRLGNLIDWQLTDQQGQRLSAGTYLFLVTVKDFSDRLTQKYGTAVLESEQVYLEQTSRGELPAPQATALEANQQAEALSAIDRIGAAGSNPTSTASTDAPTVIDGAPTGKETATSAPGTGGENATGAGSQNKIAKWTDNAGTLGDSTITESSDGRIGVGADPVGSIKLNISSAFGTIPFGFTQNAPASAFPTLALFSTADGAVGQYAATTHNGAVTFLMGATSGRNFGLFANNSFISPNLFIKNDGNVGIGTTAPSHRLSINGGPFWTTNNWSGAVELTNASAIGWQANAGGQRFGIGQSTGGLYFFRTTSNPGTTVSPANYDMVITDVGKVGIGTTSPGAKLHVDSPTGTAVYGSSGSGDGVYGYTLNGTGVYGYTASGIGVYGLSGRGTGVYGSSINGYAGYFDGKAKVTGHLEVGSCTGCTISSDQGLKANISSIDPRAVLGKLAALPISQWNYKSDGTSVRHVGPMAQDFRAAFDLGKDDKHIDMIDANGVTMASVQALYQLMLEKEKKNEQLADEVRLLRAQLQQQQAQLNQVRRSVRRRAAKR